jgi:hypothetical protein
MTAGTALPVGDILPGSMSKHSGTSCILMSIFCCYDAIARLDVETFKRGDKSCADSLLNFKNRCFGAASDGVFVLQPGQKMLCADRASCTHSADYA